MMFHAFADPKKKPVGFLKIVSGLLYVNKEYVEPGAVESIINVKLVSVSNNKEMNMYLNGKEAQELVEQLQDALVAVKRDYDLGEAILMMFKR